MSKRKYRLEPVLTVRNKAKEEAAKHLAICRDILAGAINELKEKEEAVLDCIREQALVQESMFEKSTNGIQAKDLVQYRSHLSHLRCKEEELITEVQKQRIAVSKAERDVEQALSELAEAAKEVLVIEKHYESWLKQQTRDQAIREQKQNDEIGLKIKSKQ
jgi:flagellar export protein FliJ